MTAPAVILIDPQLGENIGMCARAMLNCGLTGLRLVRPRDGWPSQKAIDSSAGAQEVVDHAQVFDTVEEAVADLTRLYATTGRSRELLEYIMTPRAAADDMRKSTATDGHRTGVLFGGERSGLSNDDVAKADVIIQVPLNPEFRSLNLAQAVLLIGYEWFTAADQTPPESRNIQDARPATQNEIDIYVERLGRGLDEGSFFRSVEMRPTVMRNIRLMYQRMQPTDQDVRTLHGIVESLRRAGPERK
ncbi:MAG: RNA methyltransferase [Alphaproteobacteria bacterium]|nr:RNA methyltransferase [Alphaproteobacteria bacterium]